MTENLAKLVADAIEAEYRALDLVDRAEGRAEQLLLDHGMTPANLYYELLDGRTCDRSPIYVCAFWNTKDTMPDEGCVFCGKEDD